MRTTAAAASEKKKKQAADFEDMLAESQREKPVKKSTGGPRAKTLRQAGTRRKVIIHKKELDEKTLDKLVTSIRQTYPEVRFNMPGSKEGVLAHYLSEMEQSKGWPGLVTTSGCKFWLNPAGELVISEDNWYK